MVGWLAGWLGAGWSSGVCVVVVGGVAGGGGDADG